MNTSLAKAFFQHKNNQTASNGVPVRALLSILDFVVKGQDQCVCRHDLKTYIMLIRICTKLHQILMSSYFQFCAGDRQTDRHMDGRTDGQAESAKARQGQAIFHFLSHFL